MPQTPATSLPARRRPVGKGSGLAQQTLIEHALGPLDVAEALQPGRLHQVQYAYVVHSGSDHSPEGRQQKLERDFKLLHLDLRERPDHPFVLFNLGMTCADCQQHESAVAWLTRCLEVSRPEESHVRKTYALLVSVLYQQQRFPEALGVCERGRELFSDDKELLFRQAMLEHQLGRLEKAAQTYRQVLDAPEDRHFTSVDVGLAGYKARHNLALVYEDLRRPDLARGEWEAILREHPTYAPAMAGSANGFGNRRDADLDIPKQGSPP